LGKLDQKYVKMVEDIYKGNKNNLKGKEAKDLMEAIFNTKTQVEEDSTKLQ